LQKQFLRLLEGDSENHKYLVPDPQIGSVLRHVPQIGKLIHQLQIEYIKRSAPRTFIKAGGALRFLSQNDSEVFCFGRFEIKFKRSRSKRVIFAKQFVQREAATVACACKAFCVCAVVARGLCDCFCAVIE
jgi:hypothetical protein